MVLMYVKLVSPLVLHFTSPGGQRQTQISWLCFHIFIDILLLALEVLLNHILGL